jgi:hypothetical protein
MGKFSKNSKVRSTISGKQSVIVGYDTVRSLVICEMVVDEKTITVYYQEHQLELCE